MTLSKSYPSKPHTGLPTLRQPPQRRSRIPVRFQGAARVRQRHYIRFAHGEPVVWLTHIRMQLLRIENAPTIRYVTEIMGPPPTCPRIILPWSEEWGRYFRQYARSKWDEAVRQDEFRWHQATQPLDFIYHSRHSYPRWEEVYEAKLVLGLSFTAYTRVLSMCLQRYRLQCGLLSNYCIQS